MYIDGKHVENDPKALADALLAGRDVRLDDGTSLEPLVQYAKDLKAKLTPAFGIN